MPSDIKIGDLVTLDLPGCPPLKVVDLRPNGEARVEWFDNVGGYHQDHFPLARLKLVEVEPKPPVPAPHDHGPLVTKEHAAHEKKGK